MSRRVPALVGTRAGRPATVRRAAPPAPPVPRARLGAAPPPPRHGALPVHAQWLSTAEAARLLRCSPAAVRTAIELGQLRGVRVGSHKIRVWAQSVYDLARA